MAGNSTAECNRIAMQTAEGKLHEDVFVASHMSSNLREYYETTVGRFPERNVYVVRTEHLWDDLKSVDQYLGGTGDFGTRDGFAVTHGSHQFATVTPLSPVQQQAFCCALRDEFQVYETLVHKAVNLDDATKNRTLNDAMQHCSFDSWQHFLDACDGLKSSTGAEVQVEAERVSTDTEARIEPKETFVSAGNKLDGLNFLILLSLNDAHLDFFANWWSYYTKLGIPNQVLVIAEDKVVYDKLMVSGLPIWVERSDFVGADGALDFGSPEYKRFVSERPKRILKYLRQGRNVLYIDTDTVLLSNPLPYLVDDTSIDLWAQDDGASADSGDMYCTGFMGFRANDRVIETVEKWAEILASTLKANQFTFNTVWREQNLTVRGLSTYQFPHGDFYFERFDDEQRKQVVVVHNNWIVGHQNKIDRFQKFGLWNPDAQILALQRPVAT